MPARRPRYDSLYAHQHLYRERSPPRWCHCSLHANPPAMDRASLRVCLMVPYFAPNLKVRPSYRPQGRASSHLHAAIASDFAPSIICCKLAKRPLVLSVLPCCPVCLTLWLFVTQKKKEGRELDSAGQHRGKDLDGTRTM